MDKPISAVLTDIDGTLLTKDKVLTPRALKAVAALHEHGIGFTVTSGRPPFGMRWLVEPLRLTLPMAAFNGGAIVAPDSTIFEEHRLPERLLPGLVQMLEDHGLDVWLFRCRDWCVRALEAPRVARETSNVKLPPVVVTRFEDFFEGAVKVVGVSEDHPRVALCEAAVQRAFGARLSAARSQPHYLDVTHPEANKGVVIERLSRYINVPLERIAVLGDQPNDVLMFEKAGLSIAMGNSSDEVKRKADRVTTSFADEGFAIAIEQFIIPECDARGRKTHGLHRS